MFLLLVVLNDRRASHKILQLSFPDQWAGAISPSFHQSHGWRRPPELINEQENLSTKPGLTGNIMVRSFQSQSLQSISVKWWWTPPWFPTSLHFPHSSPYLISWVPSAPGHWWRAEPRGSERFDGGVAQTLRRACKCHADHWHIAHCAWSAWREPIFSPCVLLLLS